MNQKNTINSEIKNFIGTEQEMFHWIKHVFIPSFWGQNPCIIFLNGDLGTGKSTFTRHFLQCQGITGAIKSPTYSLMEHYTVNYENTIQQEKNPSSKTFYHFDLYRMQYAQEWEEMGFDEYLTAQSKAWCLIEWPDKVFSLNLNDSNSVANLIINFESTNNGLQRVLTIQTI